MSGAQAIGFSEADQRAFEECMAIQVAARQAAEADIAQLRAFAVRHGIDLTPPAPRPRAPRKRHSALDKSLPQLDQWLRRALPDGTLPMPTENLIIPEAIVRRGLALGYIEGTAHPYHATYAGLAYAAGRIATR